MGSSGVRVAHFLVDAFAWATGVESDRFPAEMLWGTQFGSYVIPGLILSGSRAEEYAELPRTVLAPSFVSSSRARNR